MENKSINSSGCSVCAPGKENYTKYVAGACRGREYYQYDYRHTNGRLFSCVDVTLENCRARRDEWLEKQGK